MDIGLPLVGDCKIEFFDFNDPKGKLAFWHSSAHLLGQALEMKFGSYLCIGPALNNGFYYDSYIGDKRIT